jgi:putative inorganic carbon (hco3(-)) transporter
MPADALKYFPADRLDKLIEWYGTALLFFLLAAVVLLGTGRIELFSPKVSITSWSISRTTFFFWLGWKLLIAMRERRLQIDRLKGPIPLSLFLFFVLVALSLMPDFHAAGDFRYLFFGCVHALMVIDLFKDPKRAHLLFLLLGLLPGLLTVRGILGNPSVLSLDPMSRLGFPLDHPNTAGYLFVMSIPLALGLILSEKRTLRALAMVSFAAQLAGLVLTYSRGAWLAWIASMVFLLVISKRWRLILCLLLVPAVLYAFVKPLQERALTLMTPQTDIALNDRMRVMKGALELGYENPILGIGYGRGRLKEALKPTYEGTADETSPIWHAHNVYVELFAETGILGLGAFLWLMARAFSRVMRQANSAKDEKAIIWIALGAAWVGFVVAGLGDVPFYHHEPRIFFFTLLGLSSVVDMPAVSVHWP